MTSRTFFVSEEHNFGYPDIDFAFYRPHAIGGAPMATFIDYRTPLKVEAYLDDIIFPCSRYEILRCAEENEAPDAILDAIESLPEHRYRDIKEILGKFE